MADTLELQVVIGEATSDVSATGRLRVVNLRLDVVGQDISLPYTLPVNDAGWSKVVNVLRACDVDPGVFTDNTPAEAANVALVLLGRAATVRVGSLTFQGRSKVGVIDWVVPDAVSASATFEEFQLLKHASGVFSMLDQATGVWFDLDDPLALLLARKVLELRDRAEPTAWADTEALEAIRGLLADGEHEGPCTIYAGEAESACRQHAAQRLKARAAARAILVRAEA